MATGWSRWRSNHAWPVAWKRWQLWALLRSPRSGLSSRCPSSRRARLALLWAPRASTGSLHAGAGRARGARPRPSRSTSGAPAAQRSTLSSMGFTIGRVWLSTASARAASASASRSSSVAIGSPERLALVATRAPPPCSSSSCCKPLLARITPSQGLSPATASLTGAEGRRRSSTIGAAADPHSSSSWGVTWQWRITHGRLASRARGLSGRPLRRRHCRTACS